MLHKMPWPARCASAMILPSSKTWLRQNIVRLPRFCLTLRARHVLKRLFQRLSLKLCETPCALRMCNMYKV